MFRAAAQSFVWADEKALHVRWTSDGSLVLFTGSLGFALQLGLLGLIGRAGGFEGVSGDPEVFEYWSLAKYNKQFGPACPTGAGNDPARQYISDYRCMYREPVERPPVRDEVIIAQPLGPCA